MNRAILIGNIGTDPRVFRNEQNELTMVTFRMATTQKRKAGDETQWHNIKVLDKHKLPFASEYLKKGAKVAVSGLIDEREYEVKDGKQRITEIVLGFHSELELLYSPGGQRQEGDDKQGSSDSAF